MFNLKLLEGLMLNLAAKRVSDSDFKISSCMRTLGSTVIIFSV